MTSLIGKRVLITGGAGGLGRAVVERMLHAGARVLVADRDNIDLETLSEVAHANIETIAADLSSSAGIARMFACVDDWLGGLDILVACAGVGSGPVVAPLPKGPARV